MADENLKTPAALQEARELAARFAYLFADQNPPLDCRRWFEALEHLPGFEPRPCLRSELGRESRFVIRQLALGPASHLVAVIRLAAISLAAIRLEPPVGERREAAATGAVVDAGKASRTDRDPSQWREWLWPAADLPPTDIVYDCGEEILHGKAKPILCDLSSVPMRVFAILPTQVERLVLSVRDGRASLGAADASGRVVAARVPFQVTTNSARGDRSSYVAAAADGWLRNAFDMVGNNSGDKASYAAAQSSGALERMVRVRCLLNGLTVVVRVVPGKAPECLDELWDPQPAPSSPPDNVSRPSYRSR